jgi:hypothetical protein
MGGREDASFGKLPKKTQDAIRGSLTDGERPLVVIQGMKPCVIVGTDRRAFLFKKGLLAGATFGHKLASFDYKNVTGVEVHTGAMTGAMVLHVPGAISVSTSYWGIDKSDPWKAYNAMPIGRPFGDAERGAARLRELIAAYQAASGQGAEMDAPSALPDPAPATAGRFDLLDALKRLGELRDADVLTPEEFEVMKADLLGADRPAAPTAPSALP